MNITVYLKLIRWKNLLLIIYTYFLIKLLFLPSLLIETTLNLFSFLILLFAIVFITAAGYIINDINDVVSDKINKPKKLIVSTIITEEKARNWYKITNTIGIALGFAFCLRISKPTFSFVFIGASLLLYFYAKKLKSKPILGNLIVAFLIGLSIFILGFLELDFSSKHETQKFAFDILTILSVFAFLINLTREIIKDIEDVNGDYALKMKTLPIIIGIRRTKYIALGTLLVAIGLLLFILNNFIIIYKFTMLYLLITVFLPILYLTVKLYIATKTIHFKKISLILKIIMFLGVNSLIIFSIFH